MKTEDLLRKLDWARERERVFKSLSGVGLLLRVLKKFRVYGLTYTIFLFFQLFPRVAPVEVQTFWGGKMRVLIPDASGTKLWFNGVLGRNEHKLTAFFIKTLTKNDVFYDCGASYGFYSQLAEYLGVKEVHAFEPSERIYPLLRKNVPENVIANKIGVGDKIGSVTLYDEMGRGGSGSSSIVRETTSTKAHASSIKLTTLDEYIKTHTAPTVIKLDIEGAEAQALRGAQKLLSSLKPIIAMEVWSGEGKRGYSNSKEALGILENHGYQPFKIAEDGMLSSLSYEFFETADFGWDNFVFQAGGEAGS